MSSAAHLAVQPVAWLPHMHGHDSASKEAAEHTKPQGLKRLRLLGCSTVWVVVVCLSKLTAKCISANADLLIAGLLVPCWLVAGSAAGRPKMAGTTRSVLESQELFGEQSHKASIPTACDLAANTKL